jgi:antitoxin MazE
MQTQVIQVGNSLGIRLPKFVLDSFSLEKSAKLDIQTKSGAIVLRPLRKPRQGWAEAFVAAPAAQEDLWDGLPIADAWEDADA